MMVMLLFGIFGFAALVIDMGFARLTQRQMQTAVDSAALEGLRWRDVQLWEQLPQSWLANSDFQAQVGVGPNPPDPITSQQRDAIRRWAASQSVAQLFPANPSPNPDPDPANYGAGPVVDFTPAVGPSYLTAGRTITIPNPPVYQPARADGTPGLELNVATNDPSGDLVAGTYELNPNYPAASGGSADPADENEQNKQYNRRDFVPSPSVLAGQTAPAFLVRMRRTNNPNGLDSIPGVSSSGPTLPILFGSGSMMAQTGGGGQLSVASGITVRGTAIAAAEDSVNFDPNGNPNDNYSVGRAKTAGAPIVIPASGNQSAVAMPGVAPFALSGALWNNASSWTLDASSSPTIATLQVNSDGTLTAAGATTVIGQAMLPALIGIGQSVVAAGNAAPLTGVTDPTLYQYVPIYADDGVIGPGSIVVGFGQVTWSLSTLNGTTTLTLTRGTKNPVGSGNVSGVLAMPLPVTLTQQNANTLFQDHAGLPNSDGSPNPDALVYPLCASVLVDRYIGPSAGSSN
jgi:hypothetical protein